MPILAKASVARHQWLDSVQCVSRCMYNMLPFIALCQPVPTIPGSQHLHLAGCGKPDYMMINLSMHLSMRVLQRL